MSFTSGLSFICRQRIGPARELLARLVEMIQIEMRIAESVDELARLQTGHLRHHHREQRIGRDVERHAEEDIGRALIELAGELAVADIELEQAVARRQRHLLDVGGVPGGHDQAARIGVALDLRSPQSRSGRWSCRPAPASCAIDGHRPGRARPPRPPIRSRWRRRSPAASGHWCRRRGTRAARRRSTSDAASWW